MLMGQFSESKSVASRSLRSCKLVGLTQCRALLTFQKKLNGVVWVGFKFVCLKPLLLLFSIVVLNDKQKKWLGVAVLLLQGHWSPPLDHLQPDHHLCLASALPHRFTPTASTLAARPSGNCRIYVNTYAVVVTYEF